jgi:sporulation protein YlmC with PRC-barrel domain
MKKLLLVSMVLPALVVGPLAVAAQTSVTPGTRDGKSAPSRKALTATDKAATRTTAQSLVEAGDLIGMHIRSEVDQDVGTVDNLLIDPKTGKVSQVVVAIGGLLGFGTTKVVVPWTDLKAAMTMEGTTPIAKMNEAKLQAAPRYERNAAAEHDRASSMPSASPATTKSGATKK